MGVKNGSLGTVLKMDDHAMTVRLDTGPVIAFDTTRYRDLDYGYAATIHKTQGTTVDRSFVLATHHFDKHTTYVAMPRGLESQDTAWAPEKDRTQILGYYTRNVDIDGKKYAVLEDFDTQKKHFVPFKEEYGQLKMFRAMQYDGQMLQYAPDKSKSPPHKSLSTPGKELPEKER
jgi:hypothetical protein